MKKRVLSAIAGLVLLFAVLLLNQVLTIRIALIVISLFALYELYVPFGYWKQPWFVWLGVLISVLILFGPIQEARYSIPVIVGYVLLLAIGLLAFHKTVRFCDVTRMLFFTVYIPFFLNTIVLTRNLVRGEFLIWLIFGGAWLTDTFAFFTGTFLGKHKLCPDISPKKTWEGAIGGVVGTAVMAMVYGVCLERFAGLNVQFGALFCLAVLASVVSMVGDLTASLIKRELQIKDFGSVMPGHGGILDRFDSILLVAPLVYAFLVHITVFS